MLSGNVKKRVAVFLLFALCAGVCPEAKEGKAAEPVSSDYTWYDDDELILPVYLSDKKEWMDEKGFVYYFDDTKKTAEITRIKLSYYLGDEGGCFDHAPGDIVLRPPDKVICNGETYVVTSLSIIGDVSKVVRIHLYIGKYITWVALYSLDIKVTSYVHYANKKYVSDRGSLFTADRKELCRFCDETYGADETYVVPKSVQTIGQWAFFRAEIEEVRLNDNITWIYPYAFQDSYIHRIDLDQVEIVGDGAFSECPFLEEVTFGKENVKLGIGAFSNTPALKNVYIPDWCTIGKRAFESSGIETLIMGKGVQMDAGDDLVDGGITWESAII
ncbi:MAG: leucine-rich repeat domain-containing protein [Roseburia sp.]|nr:leucine-rich repeat domain-containing protein [Roseburia sp.]